MHFTATTWNVLAQAYAHPDRYPFSSTEDLAAGPRRALLLRRIREMDADLFLFQEVEDDLFHQLTDVLPEHDGVYAQRLGRPDGCALFTRRSVFTVESVETLRYKAEEQVAIIATLAQAERRMAVAATHLRWQAPRTTPDKHLGALQLAELMAAIPNDLPRIIGGDFNANSQSLPLMQAMAQGLRLSCRSQRPWDTTNINGRRRKLDYLLYDPSWMTPTPGTLPKLQRDTPMPSSTEPSDHFAVSVRFDWMD
ncbi:MAG: endonuclease/exonuclease/phosphatase family protein [Myxococcota bacterium]